MQIRDLEKEGPRQEVNGDKREKARKKQLKIKEQEKEKYWVSALLQN